LQVALQERLYVENAILKDILQYVAKQNLIKDRNGENQVGKIKRTAN
jgi:hypothetical protein